MTQLNATKLFRNISQRTNALRELIQNENLENLIGKCGLLIQLLDGVSQQSTKEVKQIYLDAIFNLSQIEECVPELCRHGLLNILSNYFSLSGDIELIRYSAKVLDKIVSDTFK